MLGCLLSSLSKVTDTFLLYKQEWLVSSLQRLQYVVILLFIFCFLFFFSQRHGKDMGSSDGSQGLRFACPAGVLAKNLHSILLIRHVCGSSIFFRKTLTSAPRFYNGLPIAG